MGVHCTWQNMVSLALPPGGISYSEGYFGWFTGNCQMVPFHQRFRMKVLVYLEQMSPLLWDFQVVCTRYASLTLLF